MNDEGITVLVNEALLARKQSVSPYSKFAVGAALRTVSGQIIHGANVESASYGLTCCAERIALFKALTEGHSAFESIAIVADHDEPVMPCGACRQLLSEYAPNAICYVADVKRPEDHRRFTVKELLPGAFRLR